MLITFCKNWISFLPWEKLVQPKPEQLDRFCWPCICTNENMAISLHSIFRLSKCKTFNENSLITYYTYSIVSGRTSIAIGEYLSPVTWEWRHTWIVATIVMDYGMRPIKLAPYSPPSFSYHFKNYKRMHGMKLLVGIHISAVNTKCYLAYTSFTVWNKLWLPSEGLWPLHLLLLIK